MKVDNLDVTLYKTVNRATQITRVWRCYTQGNTVYFQHGLIDGQHQVDTRECTTPENALSVAQSKIAHKQAREGYSEDINANPPGLPMLLHNFRMHGDKLPQDVYYQPKLDGHRCIGSRNLMMTRKNDIITSMPHIQDELRQLPKNVILDGELYCHGMSLQEHSSLIRQHEPPAEHQRITYQVFDIQTKGPYRERLEILAELFDNHSFNKVQLLPFIKGKKSNAEGMLEKHIKIGYEGVIIRAPEGTYATDYRTYSAQKLKPIFSEWFKITDFTAADKGREKGAAIAVCVTEDNQTFRARMTGDTDLRRFIYKNKELHLPAIARIEYADYTENGIPQHPRCVEFLIGGNLAQEKKKAIKDVHSTS